MKKILLTTLLILSSLTLSAKPYCVAHRGLGYGELENSLSAFEAASKAGAAAIEFDLLHSADGKTLVYHDSVLKRLTLGSSCPIGKKINKLTKLEISQNCKLKNGEEIPSFESALKLLSQYDSKLFIELKDTVTNSDFELIKSYYPNRAENIFIISFDKKALQKVLNYREVDDYFKDIKVIRLKKYGYFGKFDKYDGLDAKFIHKSKVRKLKRQGKVVGVYTKTSKRKIKKYLRKGVDFITTNNSSRCEEIIDKL